MINLLVAKRVFCIQGKNSISKTPTLILHCLFRIRSDKILNHQTVLALRNRGIFKNSVFDSNFCLGREVEMIV